MTLALSRKYSTDNLQLNILGIDIDETLIERAKKANENSDNKTEPSSDTCGRVDFVCADVMSEKGSHEIQKFLEANGAEKFDVIFLFR